MCCTFLSGWRASGAAKKPTFCAKTKFGNSAKFHTFLKRMCYAPVIEEIRQKNKGEKEVLSSRT